MTPPIDDHTRAEMVTLGRALGRAHRVNRASAVYAWLDSLEPPRNLQWLAGELGVARPTLQNWVNGERRQRKGRLGVSRAPAWAVERVRELSRGAVGPADWPGGVSEVPHAPEGADARAGGDE